jgi:hypothetical protein
MHVANVRSDRSRSLGRLWQIILCRINRSACPGMSTLRDQLEPTTTHRFPYYPIIAHQTFLSPIFSTTLGRTRVGSARETNKLKDLSAFRDVCLRIFRDFLAVIGSIDAGREFRIIVAEVSVVCHYISN